MIKMHVPMMLVMLQLDADSFQNKSRILICVPLEPVMQLKESLIPQETVMMEINVPSTIVILQRDANLFLNWFLKTVQLNLQDAMEMYCA
jgi:hypothetical protein